ncbi:MAG: pentapeptide repeat-containing protein [Deltaproteobacteria bacterium]|nr:pentapeptide repeat-containing protein [Deltaproteobacteria bacterium]
MISDLGIWAIMINLIALVFAVQYSRSKTLGEALLWLAWDFTGFRFIASKVFPTQKGNASPPVTITLWVLGIYTALFGIASNRYENAVDKIENRMNAFITQLSVATTEVRTERFSEAAKIQRMDCPEEPDLLHPSSVFLSFVRRVEYSESVQTITRTIEQYKNSLQGAKLSWIIMKDSNLSGGNLRNADLFKVDFENANLSEVSLLNARLIGANFKYARLNNVDFGKSDLTGAKFEKASLKGANFENAKFSPYPLEMSIDYEKAGVTAKIEGESLEDIESQTDKLMKSTKLNKSQLLILTLFRSANLNNADLSNTNLIGAEGLYVEQLCSTRTLHNAKMDPELEDQVRIQCPERLEDPHKTKEAVE